ncbi:UNVERIFIED_CONTAM: hypothetical protein Slati_0467600 [Sesamum latifolium]|uniref:Retrotransposon gag domain-containing protein n=1 Tax=Sesamum latifolium TaxID=2727402 RepID=A0AAW2XWC6_9LAMI
MANSNNEADQGSYGGNSSLPPASGPGISSADPSLGDIGVSGPDTVLGADTPIPIPAPGQTGGLAVLNPLLCEQLRQFIMDTINSAIRGSQTSGIGPSSQIEKGGTLASQGTGEQAPSDSSKISPFLRISESKRQLDTLPRTPGSPCEQIMTKELPAHFRAPAHLPMYDGSIDPAEHIRRFDNVALLHRYTDSIKYRVFLTTLTNSAQQWFDQLLAGSIRSFAEFSSLFQHQFANSKKYQKSVISLFGVKQEDNETIRAYVQRFNTTSLRSQQLTKRC